MGFLLQQGLVDGHIAFAAWSHRLARKGPSATCMASALVPSKGTALHHPYSSRESALAHFHPALGALLGAVPLIEDVAGTMTVFLNEEAHCRDRVQAVIEHLDQMIVGNPYELTAREGNFFLGHIL